MKEGRSADKGFLQLQHRLRGLVAEFRSRKFSKNRTSTPSSRLRAGLRRLFLDARITLKPGQFDMFLEWADNYRDTQVPELAHIAVGFDELTGVITAPPTSLERELSWTAARLRAETPKISAFRVGVEQIESLTYHGEYDQAIEHLARNDRMFGTSLWSVQLRIALEHQAGGLERQKKYTAGVRQIYKRGLLGFTAFHTSVRNEDRTTLAKFVEDVRGRIDTHSYFEPAVKLYSRYRLTGELPNTNTGISDILRVEQSHSIIDIYETFVAVVQEIVRRQAAEEERDLVVGCLTRLSGIADFRLLKALNVLSEETSERLPPRTQDISDCLLAGGSRKAAQLARKFGKTGSVIDVWEYVYAGAALASLPKATKYPRAPTEVVQMIATILGRQGLAEDSLAPLRKLSTNFSGLPLSAGLLEFFQQIRRVQPDSAWCPWLVGLNSPTIGIEDAAPMARQGFRSTTKGEKLGPTNDAWLCLVDPQHRPQRSVAAGHLFTAARLLRDQRFEDAESELLHVDPNCREPTHSILQSLRLHLYSAIGDKQRLIALIAEEGTRSDAHRQMLPILSSLGPLKWSDYKEMPVGLAPPLALHLQWIEDESSATQSYVRFATGNFLKKAALSRPSHLLKHASSYVSHQLIYFLWEVCVPQVLDTARVLKSSLEVMEERQAICAALKTLDPDNASFYEAEIMAISNQLVLEAGQRIVNSVRIHVDQSAFGRWASRELAEDFGRFTDLLKVNLTPKQNFDDVLKEILATAQQPTAFKPEGEADAVLVSIMHRLRDEFLNNSSFGLDFYLSKRIRHQSFIGLIRGPLEFAHLITTRESESGSYRRNTFWLDKFGRIDLSAKESISQALDSFATKFDDMLSAAKDNSFQVRSVEKPNGLLTIELQSPVFALARAMAAMDQTPHVFFVTAHALLWGALAPSLARVRLFISEELKTCIAESLDALRARVRNIADQDPALLEFNMEIAKRSSEVQSALNEAASWFTYWGIEVHQHRFELDQVVKICIDTALRYQRPFEPVMITEVQDGKMQMDAQTLVFVHDVLFIAIGNARKHSGLDRPTITIRVRPDTSEGTLSVEVLSDCRSTNRAAKEKQSRDIRELIDTGSAGRKTRDEEKSGFLKLDAVIKQSTKGRLEFGFNSEGRYRLAVIFSLLTTELSEKDNAPD